MDGMKVEGGPGGACVVEAVEGKHRGLKVSPPGAGRVSVTA